ncbi:MAG: CAP domain-containing protein [Pseudolabrys sp.]|nr:CAP domain-containing protein [Pseudolabrys sp.]
MRRSASPLFALAACLALAAPARAFDINTLRAKHRLPPLAVSAALAGAAHAHARDLAARRHLDHRGFRERVAAFNAIAAENVAYGCPDADCAFRMWSRSPAHRRNMLLRGLTHYGLASAVAADGRRYWVLELGSE